MLVLYCFLNLRVFHKAFSMIVFILLTHPQIASALTGDFNADGKVDLSDFVLFLDGFGTSDARYDLDNDGTVGLDDFVIFIDNFGRTEALTGPTENVSLSLGVPLQAPTVSPKVVGAPGSNQSIAITRVRLLLEEVKLKTSVEDIADFKIGPVVVDLNLQGAITQIGAGSIPIGIYNKFEFKVKKLDADDADPDDPQFADFAGTEKSIIIEGIHNSVGFTLSIEQDFEQETELIPPLEIASDTSATNLSLMVNVTNWLVGSDPTELLNLTDPTIIEQIAANIAQSFEAFEDDDGDGELDFEGDVSTVNLDNNSFTLTNSLIVVTDSTTIFEGSIVSLDSVESLLSQGKEVEVEGEGSRQTDGSVFATEVKFESEEEERKEDDGENGEVEGKAPTIDAVNPNSVPTGTDAVVTITGSNFFNTPDSIRPDGIRVSIDGIALAVTFGDSTTLRATIPGTVAEGQYDVTVTNPDDQSATLSRALTVEAVEEDGTAPTIDAVVPDHVPLGMDSVVTITGSNFFNTPDSIRPDGIRVSIDGIMLAVTFGDSTTLRATIPGTTPEGVYDVTVTNPDDQSVTLSRALTVEPE